MSKLIKITEEYVESLKQEFEEMLRGKISDGRIAFNKVLGATQDKATVYFNEKAWFKMQSLVSNFSTEVAWHGLAEKINKGEYLISDILVYPQEVTGATVTTDQEKYQTWLMEHDDEVFNKIRMQGHSHVNMSTSPSGVDTSLYERILDQLGSDMFYIFMIYNKKGEKTIKIYDMKDNILYETADVTVEVLEDELGLVDFVSKAKEMVANRTPSYSQPKTTSSYSGYGYNGYGGYSSYYGAGYNESRDLYGRSAYSSSATGVKKNELMTSNNSSKASSTKPNKRKGKKKDPFETMRNSIIEQYTDRYGV